MDGVFITSSVAHHKRHTHSITAALRARRFVQSLKHFAIDTINSSLTGAGLFKRFSALALALVTPIVLLFRLSW
jgi:hypothetical protein